LGDIQPPPASLVCRLLALREALGVLLKGKKKEKSPLKQPMRTVLLACNIYDSETWSGDGYIPCKTEGVALAGRIVFPGKRPMTG